MSLAHAPAPALALAVAPVLPPAFSLTALAPALAPEPLMQIRF